MAGPLADSLVKAEFHLPRRSTAPRIARAGVSVTTRSLGRDVADSIELLTSELVTNAIRHTRADPLAEVIVRVDIGAERIRVEVLNPGPSFDPPAPSGADPSGTGLGLFLVHRLADAWGVDRERWRTKVWFEISKRRYHGA